MAKKGDTCLKTGKKTPVSRHIFKNQTFLECLKTGQVRFSDTYLTGYVTSISTKFLILIHKLKQIQINQRSRALFNGWAVVDIFFNAATLLFRHFSSLK